MASGDWTHLIADVDHDWTKHFAMDAAFEEGKHPRAENGQFGQGGSGGLPNAKLTPKEKAYIDNYSGDEFLKINNKLRSGEDAGPSAAKLDSAMAKSRVPSGSKLYRGLSRNAFKQMIGGDELVVGNSFSDKGFVSTSKDRRIAESLSIGGILLEIDVGDDQHGLDISALSRNKHENEVLLDRNSQFTITGLKAPKHVGAPVIVRVKSGPK